MERVEHAGGCNAGGYRAAPVTRNPPAPALAMVTHDSAAELERNLTGQLSAAEALGSALVVVDNASSDRTPALLEERAGADGPLEVLRLPRNRGYAAAVNRAFARLAGSDVMVLNPDVELPGPGPVEALAEHLRSRSRAGVAAPKLIGADGAVQPSARRAASAAAMLGSLPLARFAPPLRRSYERYLGPSRTGGVATVGWVIGAAMLIRRSAYEEVGGFDEGFFLYMEDADFCRRLGLVGWDVDYVPAVRLRHGYARASSAAGATVAGSAARRQHIRSLARYWRKHPGALVGAER